MKKNSMFQIMRVVFCLVIVQFHFRSYEVGLAMPTGYLATDYFFIISGYLMMASAAKKETSPGNILDDTRKYIFHKFGKLLPYYLASYVVAFFSHLVFEGASFARAGQLLASSLSELLLVGESGLYEYYLNGAVWFLSALFLGSLLLYPICRRLQRNFSNLLAPLFALFALGYLDAHIHYYGTARYPYGLVRGIVDLCIGCSVFGFFQSGWQEKLLEGTDQRAVRRRRAAFSFLEIGAYLAALVCMHFLQAGDTDYLTIFFLVIGIAVTASGLSYTANIPASGRWFGIVSTGTMVVFLSHERWPILIGDVFPDVPAKSYFLALGCVVVAVAVVWLAGGFVSKRRGGIGIHIAAVLGLCVLVFGMQKLCMWKYVVARVPLGEEKSCQLYYDEYNSRMILLYPEQSECDSAAIRFDTAEDPAVLAQLAPDAALSGSSLEYAFSLSDEDEDVAFGWKTKTVQIPYIECTSLRWGVGENGETAQLDQELEVLPAPKGSQVLEIRDFTDGNWTNGILNMDSHQLILEPGTDTVIPGQYFRTESGRLVRVLSADRDDGNGIYWLTLDSELTHDEGGPNHLFPVSGENGQ